jgi:hypothetical protein
MSMPTNLDSSEAEGTIIERHRSISAERSLVELAIIFSIFCVGFWSPEKKIDKHACAQTYFIRNGISNPFFGK